MLRKVGTIATASILSTSVLGDEGKNDEKKKETNIAIEYFHNDSRYATTEFTSIRKGATNYNYPGFW